MNEKYTRSGLYLEKELLRQADENLKRANVRSRNEFINEAIRFYIGYLQCEDDGKYLTPALESVISGKINDTENRIVRVLFKLAVEVDMMMNVVAHSNDIDKPTLNSLRKLCVEEVSRTNGRFNFDDAVNFQKGE